MKRPYSLALIPCLVLAGCAGVTAPLPGRLRPPELSTCGAVTMQGLVGQNIAAAHVETLSRPFRTIRPGTAITMDYNAGRVNFDLDDHDVIGRIWCG